MAAHDAAPARFPFETYPTPQYQRRKPLASLARVRCRCLRRIDTKQPHVPDCRHVDRLAVDHGTHHDGWRTGEALAE
jgi:hypothetical protein